MAAKAEAKFELKIGALDKFTVPFKNFADKVEKSTEKVRKFALATQMVSKNISGHLGLPRLGSSFKNLGSQLSLCTDRAGQFLGRVGGVAKGLGFLGLAGGGAAAGLFGLAKMAAAVGDEADETAQKIGLTATSWQELSAAGRLTGVENSLLESSFNKLNVNMVAAAKGSKDQAQAFKSLGVSLKNEKGYLKDADTMFMDIAEAFSRLPEGSQKAALANQVFGKSGAQLLPMLNEGKDGLQNWRKEAVKMGAVLGGDAVAAGAKFNETLDISGMQLKGLAVSVGAQLLPPLTTIVETIGNWATKNKDLIATKVGEFVEQISLALPDLLTSAEEFIGNIPGWIEDISAFVDSIGGWETVLVGVGLFLAGPMIAAVLGLIPPIVSLGAAILTTPIGWVMAAIAGLVAVGVAIYKNWDAIVGFFKACWQKIKDIFAGAIKFFTDKWDKVTGAFKENPLEGILTFFKEFNPLSLINDVIAKLTGFDLFAVGQEWLSGLSDGVLGGADGFLAKFINWICGFFAKIKDYFCGKIDNIKAAFSEGWLPGIISVFTEFSPITMLGDFASGIFDFLLSFEFVQIGLAWLTGLWDGIVEIWNSIIVFFKKGWQKIKDIFAGAIKFLTDKWDKIAGAFSENPLEGIITFFKEFNPLSLINDLIASLTGFDLFAVGQEWLSGLTGGVMDGAFGLWSRFTGWLGDFVSGIKNYFLGKIETIKSAFSEGWIPGIMSVFEEFSPITLLGDFVSGIFDFLMSFDFIRIGLEWLAGIWDGFVKGWDAFADWVWQKITALIPDFVLDWFADEEPDKKEAAPEATAAERRQALLGPGENWGDSMRNGNLVVSKETINIEKQELSLKVQAAPGTQISPTGGVPENATIQYAPAYLGVANGG